jgi:hypothetical protein
MSGVASLAVIMVLRRRNRSRLSELVNQLSSDVSLFPHGPVEDLGHLRVSLSTGLAFGADAPVFKEGNLIPVIH